MAVLAGLALLSGCAGDGAREPPAGGDDGAAARTQLTISFWAEGRAAGDPAVATLRCDPAGGQVENPERVCERLDRLDDAFAPLPADAVCTEIYGGPAEAEVVGRHEGRRVDAQFSRRNGCEIARWERHAFLFPPAP